MNPTAPRRVVLPVAGALLLGGLRAGAHDYWLLPDPLRAARPSSVTVSLWVGDDFVPEAERPWQRQRATRFERLTANGRVDLRGAPIEDARPLLRLALDRPGGNLLALDRNPSHIELPADRFEHYLHDEGLDAIITARASLGESARPGRERYSRSLKAFVQIGARPDGASMRAVGQTLELTPGVDLARLRTGQPLPVSVRFRGAPIANVTVEALSRVGDDVRRARAVSDALGRVRFTVDRDGTWLVRAVHMVRCEGCADADWESFWSAYTFGVCAPATTVCAAAPMTLAPAEDAGSPSP